MIHETIKLRPDSNATLTTYIHDKKIPKKAILIFPGGGYKDLANHENEPVALAYAGAGFNVFVLRYSVKDEAKEYAPLIDASYAMKFIRDNAEKYNVNSDYIFVCGFSAGAHLAAWLGTCWNSEKIPAELRGINKPTGMILSYPVISAGYYKHLGSFENLAGKKSPKYDEISEFSLEKKVSADTCPAFIWHTFEDEKVNVYNSLLFAETMKDNNIPFELHIFPKGLHGLSLANEASTYTGNYQPSEHVAQWFNLSLNWIKTI